MAVEQNMQVHTTTHTVNTFMVMTLMNITPTMIMGMMTCMNITIIMTTIPTNMTLFQVSHCKKVLSAPTSKNALRATTSAQKVVHVYPKVLSLLLLKNTAHFHPPSATVDNTSTSTLAPVSVLNTHSLSLGSLPYLLYLEDLFTLRTMTEERTGKDPRKVDEEAAKGDEEVQKTHW